MHTLLLIISAILLGAAPAEEEKKDSISRNDTIPVLISQKSGGKEGFANYGRQEYWWHDAHSQGPREKLMNNGYVLEWAISPQYDNASKRFEEGLAGVEINGKIGYIDERNRFILPPEFTRHKFPKGFRKGLTTMYKDGKYGYMDKRGEVVIDPIFEDVEPFGDNMIAYVRMNSRYGAIDLKGDTVISCRFTTPESMRIGRNQQVWRKADSLVQERLRQGYYDDELDQIRKAEKWADGLIADESFRNAIPDGVTVADSLGRFGLKKGQEWILKAQFDSLAPAAAGIFIAAKDGKFGACDSWGRTVLGCEFASVVYQPEAELYIVSDENGKFGLYDYKGAMVLPPCLDYIKDFINGQAEAAIGTETCMIDTHGQATNEDFHGNVINMSMLDSNVETRIATLRQLIAFKPTYAKAHNNLAACYVATEKFKVGIPMLKLAHRLDPEDEVIKKNLDEAKYDRKQKTMTIAFTVVGVVASVALAAVAVAADAVSSDGGGGGGGSYSSGSSGGSYSSGGSSKSSSGSSSGVSQSELQSQYDDAINNIRRIKDSWGDHVGTQGEVSNRENLNNVKNTIRKIKKRASEKGFSLRTDSLENWNP